MVDHSTISAEFWARITPLLEAAVERSHGRYLLSHILHQILTGYQQLFLAFEDDEILGFVVTQVMVYPNKKNLALHFMAGERLENWAGDMLELIERWREDNNCAGMECSGRPGLWSILKQYGWKKGYTVYEKDFAHG